MQRTVAIFASACAIVIILAAWGWARLGMHREQLLYFADSHCINVEIRPRGFHASVTTYTKGFPTNQGQAPGWMLRRDLVDTSDIFIRPDRELLGLGTGTYKDDKLYGGDGRFVTVPYWMTIVPFALVLAIALLRGRRARLRARAGLCVACGYDLRATTDRCPECGRSVPTAPAANPTLCPPPRAAV